MDDVVSVRIEVFQYLAALKRQERERIIHWIETLPGRPHDSGDYTERDASQRVLLIKVIGNHALSFWHDGAVNEFKVVKIQPAGS